MSDSGLRSPAEIEAEIAAARESLVTGVESLINRIHPRAVVTGALDGARDFAESGVGKLKREFVDESGNLRQDRLVVLAAALGGVITFWLVVRSIFASRR